MHDPTDTLVLSASQINLGGAINGTGCAADEGLRASCVIALSLKSPCLVVIRGLIFQAACPNRGVEKAVDVTRQQWVACDALIENGDGSALHIFVDVSVLSIWLPS